MLLTFNSSATQIENTYRIWVKVICSRNFDSFKEVSVSLSRNRYRHRTPSLPVHINIRVRRNGSNGNKERVLRVNCVLQ